MSDALQAVTKSGSKLSIVLIIRHPDDTPEAVLQALGQQGEIARSPVILVDGRCPEVTQNPGPVRAWLTVIKAPGLSMPQLKALGAKVAKGRAIAFLEPKAIPGADWLRRVHAALTAHPGAAFGGGVEFAGASTPANQAAFAFEYGMFTTGNIAAGTLRDLSANNMILLREPLWSLCGDILRNQGLNKPFCQKCLSEAGMPIRLVADMAVALDGKHRLWPLLKSRFSYARCFGGTRVALAQGPRRWLYRLGAPVVPFMLFWRHSGILRRIDVGQKSPASYIALAALCLAWAAGEAKGSWLGPGKACEDLY